jgi:hypothetical protein
MTARRGHRANCGPFFEGIVRETLAKFRPIRLLIQYLNHERVRRLLGGPSKPLAMSARSILSWVVRGKEGRRDSGGPIEESDPFFKF